MAVVEKKTKVVRGKSLYVEEEVVLDKRPAPLIRPVPVVSRNIGTGNRGSGFAFAPPKEFERLLGSNLAPDAKPVFYGMPTVLQLVASDRTPDGVSFHEKWLQAPPHCVPFCNTTMSLPPRLYYHDGYSCAMDALNLLVGKVRGHSSVLTFFLPPSICICLTGVGVPHARAS